MRGHGTAALNQLQAVALTSSVPEGMRRLPTEALACACLKLRATTCERQLLRRLARRISHLKTELIAVDRELIDLVGSLAPQLLDECGVELTPVSLTP